MSRTPCGHKGVSSSGINGGILIHKSCCQACSCESPVPSALILASPACLIPTTARSPRLAGLARRKVLCGKLTETKAMCVLLISVFLSLLTSTTGKRSNAVVEHQHATSTSPRIRTPSALQCVSSPPVSATWRNYYIMPSTSASAPAYCLSASSPSA